MSDWLVLMRSRQFVLLWTAMLVSSTGTFFLLVALSSKLLSSDGSGLSAAAVFACQWILPIVLPSLIRKICTNYDIRRAVTTSELTGGLCSLAIGGIILVGGNIFLIIVCLMLRGLGEAITKTARVVMVKNSFTGSTLQLASATFNISYYFGTSLGGLLGVLLVERASFPTICAIDSSTFAISALCYLAMSPVVTPKKGVAATHGVWRSAIHLLKAHPSLASPFLLLLVTTGIFQGFHNAARTILPLKLLGLSNESAMALQLLIGLAIVLGALAVAAWPRFIYKGFFAAFTMVSTSCLMAATTLSRDGMELFVSYFMFIFFFEVSFTAFQTKLITICPIAEMTTISTASNTMGTLLLVLCTLTSGALSDIFSMKWVAVAFSILAMTLTAVVLTGWGSMRKQET